MKRWGILLAMLLAACGKPEESYQPAFGEKSGDGIKEYVVGIHPLHNPERLFEVYGPIVSYIETNIPGTHFKLETSRNYEEFDKKLDSGHFDFAMPNPYQTVRSLKHGYRVFGKMGDDADFRGIILVRKDSGINKVTDLKGKKVSYPAPTALAATMMPQYYLHTHGIDVNRDIENLYVGSQESSIMNVLRGHVAAGATWPVPWKTFIQEHPDLAAQLEIKWQTGTLPNNGWVVRKDVPPELATKFAALLFGLNTNEQGREMLARLPISKFEAASDTSYQPVREYLKIFSETVRHIEY
jgi:phosphonate transport system substrate-binding protein